MYARITRVQAPPARIDDLAQAFTGSAVPALRKLSGYAGSVLAVDRGSGDGQAVSFWESKEAMKNSAGSATGIRTETTQRAGATVTSVDEVEVALIERQDAPSAPAFLRVIRSKTDPSRLDGLVQACRDQALPALRGVPGFRALNVSVNRESGSVAITGVYATAEAREAADARMADLRRSIFEGAQASPPQISLYEVLAVEFVGAGAVPR